MMILEIPMMITMMITDSDLIITDDLILILSVMIMMKGSEREIDSNAD